MPFQSQTHSELNTRRCNAVRLSQPEPGVGRCVQLGGSCANPGAPCFCTLAFCTDFGLCWHKCTQPPYCCSSDCIRAALLLPLCIRAAAIPLAISESAPCGARMQPRAADLCCRSRSLRLDHTDYMGGSATCPNDRQGTLCRYVHINTWVQVVHSLAAAVEAVAG
jgi:hypothetical protein